MKKESKRYTPSKWSSYLVPVILGILLMGLIATLMLVSLALFGIFPGI